MRGGRMVLGMGAALAALASTSTARIYGAENIERHIRQHGRARVKGRSIADQPHEHARAIARRLRQAERNAERRLDRAKKAVDAFPRNAKVVRLDDDSGAEFGLSRRGRWVPLR